MCQRSAATSLQSAAQLRTLWSVSPSTSVQMSSTRRSPLANSSATEDLDRVEEEACTATLCLCNGEQQKGWGVGQLGLAGWVGLRPGCQCGLGKSVKNVGRKAEGE